MDSFPGKIIVNDDITLELFSKNHASEYFETIHEEKDNDQFRDKFQLKYPTFEKVNLMLTDAIDDKLKYTGAPDYFIRYKGSIAGIFEFHPIEATDYVEIGYWLFKKWRRKGIMSNVLLHMIQLTNEWFKRPKVFATTPVDNVSSQELLEKLEFKKNGKIAEFSDSSGSVSKEYEYFYHF